MNNKTLLPLLIRIIGVCSFILGCYVISQINHAELAGLAVAAVGLPLVVIPIFLSLLLKSWKRLAVYILCLIAFPQGILFTAIPFYFYFRLMKDAYLKQVIKFFVIPVSIIEIILIAILFTGINKIYETSVILHDMDNTMHSCAWEQKRNKADTKSISKNCTKTYEFSVNKSECEYISSLDFNKELKVMKFDEKKQMWVFKNNTKNPIEIILYDMKYLNFTKVNSITINNKILEKKDCQKHNNIIFNVEPILKK